MSDASRPANARAEPRIERLQSWIAALLSALLHLLMLLLLMSSPPVTVTTPQGAAAGSPMVVDFVGVTRTPPPDPDAAEPSPSASRVQTTPVMRADDPVPPDVADTSDAPAIPRPPAPLPRPSAPTPAPPSPPAAARSRAHVWGQPPGMLQEDLAPVNAGQARSPAVDPGRGRGASSAGPSLEVGGYQVYYDLRSETRLRAWRDQGMTELFLPLPGTRQYMVCPLETALRRESSPCRLLDPDSPELEAIGDARQVINMHRVYRLGELLWRGPRPYR